MSPAGGRSRGAAPDLGSDRRAGGGAWSSVIVTTHQPEEAERCHRIAILDGGKLVALGTPDELRAHVAGDLVRVRGERPDEIRALVTSRLGLAGRVVDGEAPFETPRGHEIVPRIAELFGAGPDCQHRHQPPHAGRRVREADRPWARRPLTHDARRRRPRRSRSAPVLPPAEPRRRLRRPAADPVGRDGSRLQRQLPPRRGANVEYLQYFYPGVVVLTLLFTAIFSTISLIEDRHHGFLQAVLAAPVRASRWCSGSAWGAWPSRRPDRYPAGPGPAGRLPLRRDELGALAARPAVAALGFTALGFAMAWWIDSTQGYHAVMSVALIPLWMLSGAMFPARAPASGRPS